MKQFLNFPALFIPVVVAASLFVNSCKEENNETAEPSRPLLSTMSSYDKDGTLKESESYRYDTEGRIIEMTNSGGRKAVLEYSPSSVTLKEYEQDELEYLAAFTLNSQSLCTSSLSAEEEKTTSTYDTNGYLRTKVEEYGNSTSTQTYTVVNQNYVTIATQYVYVNSESARAKQQDSFGTFSRLKTLHGRITSHNNLKSATDQTDNYKTDFEFYTDKANTIDLENRGIYFLGKQNKNPVKQETETLSNGMAHTNTYTYEYDGKGRIIRKIYEGGNYEVYTYVE